MASSCYSLLYSNFFRKCCTARKYSGLPFHLFLKVVRVVGVEPTSQLNSIGDSGPLKGKNTLPRFVCVCHFATPSFASFLPALAQGYQSNWHLIQFDFSEIQVDVIPGTSLVLFMRLQVHLASNNLVSLNDDVDSVHKKFIAAIFSNLT